MKGSKFNDFEPFFHPTSIKEINLNFLHLGSFSPIYTPFE
jgi:hypothetical protein